MLLYNGAVKLHFLISMQNMPHTAFRMCKTVLKVQFRLSQIQRTKDKNNFGLKVAQNAYVSRQMSFK